MSTLRIVALAVMSMMVVGTFAAMGGYANAVGCGLIIGVIAAAGLVALIWNNPINLATIPQLGAVIKWTVIVLLFITLPALLLGMWSPAVKLSFDRWSDNNKQCLANRLDKSSLKSEPEAGVVGTLTANSGVYDDRGAEVWAIKKGSKVKAADLLGKRDSLDSEGMTKVILHNKNGDFFGGNVVYIPSRKINWNGV